MVQSKLGFNETITINELNVCVASRFPLKKIKDTKIKRTNSETNWFLYLLSLILILYVEMSKLHYCSTINAIGICFCLVDCANMGFQSGLHLTTNKGHCLICLNKNQKNARTWIFFVFWKSFKTQNIFSKQMIFKRKECLGIVIFYRIDCCFYTL